MSEPAPPPITCRSCGYDLRGIEPSGHCPECGYPVAESRAAAGGMTKREVVVVGCRLLAIWVLLGNGTVASFIAGIVGSIAAGSPPWTAQQFPMQWLWSYGASFFVALAAAAVLWFGAGFFAALVFPQDGAASAMKGGLRRFDLTTAGVILLGLYFVITGLTLIVQALGYYAYQPPGTSIGGVTFIRSNFIDGLIRLGAGVVLVLGGRGLLRVFNMLRTAGVRHDGD